MKAVVTGCLGQDGSLLCEFLAGRGYEVVGMMRRHSTPNLQNVQTLLDDESLRLVEGDLTDAASLRRILASERPDHLYNLGAQSHVGTSFEQPETTLDATGLGALRVYQAVRDVHPRTHIYQASSSECYGNTQPQAPDGRLTELDHFQPASPYGAAKVLAHHLAHVYRRAYKLHISCGILFNHESERRGVNFVTRKITRGLARIRVGLQDRLTLGNLDAVRDWGHAEDYVVAMHDMVLRDEPGDYVVATGVGHTVSDFLQAANRIARVDPAHIQVLAEESRPYDVDRLVGNPTKAKQALGWVAHTSFEALASRMMHYDLHLASREVQGA